MYCPAILPYGRTLAPLVALVCSFFSLAGCTHKQLDLPYGIAADHAGYVPARVAVLATKAWPTGARYESLPLSNISENDLRDTATQFDTFILDGFKDQPYMRGYSPTWVAKLLDAAGQNALTEEAEKYWRHENTSCTTCKNPPAYYANSVASNAGWRDWLNRLSKSVRNADAVLLPFVLYAYEKTFMDRGIQVSQRGAAVTLLLVDTNNGELLWSGGREAFSNNQQLLSSKEKTPLPPWQQVYERLYTEDIWRDFPGRQVYQ